MIDKLKLADRSYSLSDIQDVFEYIIKKHEAVTENPPIKTYINKIENGIEFKIKPEYYLKLLIPEAMKLLESTKIKVKMLKMYVFQELLK